MTQNKKSIAFYFSDVSVTFTEWEKFHMYVDVPNTKRAKLLSAVKWNKSMITSSSVIILGIQEERSIAKQAIASIKKEWEVKSEIKREIMRKIQDIKNDIGKEFAACVKVITNDFIIDRNFIQTPTQ